MRMQYNLRAQADKYLHVHVRTVFGQLAGRKLLLIDT